MDDHARRTDCEVSDGLRGSNQVDGAGAGKSKENETVGERQCGFRGDGPAETSCDDALESIKVVACVCELGVSSWSETSC